MHAISGYTPALYLTTVAKDRVRGAFRRTYVAWGRCPFDDEPLTVDIGRVGLKTRHSLAIYLRLIGKAEPFRTSGGKAATELPRHIKQRQNRGPNR
jgi:hypothetical protein